MSDTPAATLRAAAARLRETAAEDELYTRAGGSVQGLVSLVLAEPLARLLAEEAVTHLPDNECGWCDPRRNVARYPCPALAVAHIILGEEVNDA